MFRVVVFASVSAVILMGMGLLPAPEVEDIPEFSIPDIGLPEQPIAFADPKLTLPEFGKPEEVVVTRPSPRPLAEQPIAPQDIQQVSQEGRMVVPHVVNFSLDETALDADSMARLGELSNWILANPAARINIYGHTDRTGSAAYNEGLGQRRADQVARYLVAAGVPEERISVVVSFGERYPIVDTDEQSRANRRVMAEISNEP